MLAATEPRTLNPLVAADQPSRDAIFALSADLIHINRGTLRTEPALAERWSVSRDGLRYTVVLRGGLRFSDGTPLTADDVLFTFRAHLDPKVNSQQRDLLMMNGEPIRLTKVSENTIQFDLPAPYAPGERLFDSFWILPRHRLERAYSEGRLTQMWAGGAAPSELAGAGPFRLREHKPGERLVLERNPYYWKRDEAGQPLPYLDRMELVFTPDQNAQLLRLLAGEVNAVARLRPEDLAEVQKRPELRAIDAGPGLEYNFVLMNWNAAGAPGEWFRNLRFRQAVAHAVDRDSIIRLVYGGRGSAISSHVTPGNRLWWAKVNEYRHDPQRAERLLREAGFRRDGAGPLRDAQGRPVEFSLLVSASSQVRRKIATLVQDDLARLGIRAQATPIEFGSMIDAVLNTRKFEAALWGLASGDADPTSEMNVWSAAGSLHAWNMKAKDGPAPALEAWEKEVDGLMRAQMSEIDPVRRKRTYTRVQQLVAENLPMVFLVSPHILSVARTGLQNFQPAILEPVVLWNCARFFWAAVGP